MSRFRMNPTINKIPGGLKTVAAVALAFVVGLLAGGGDEARQASQDNWRFRSYPSRDWFILPFRMQADEDN